MIETIATTPQNETTVLEDYEGTLYIRGTRMKVRLIAEEARAGAMLSDILEAHPHLTVEQVQAALKYYAEHREEMDSDIERREKWVEEMRLKGQTPNWEQLAERLDSQGLVMTPTGLKPTT